MGSILFLAPEQWQGKKGSRDAYSVKGEATDIWALGVTLFFLLTFQYPYECDNPGLMRQKINNEEIDFSPIKNDSVRHVLQRLLYKDPLKRATLEELM